MWSSSRMSGLRRLILVSAGSVPSNSCQTAAIFLHAIASGSMDHTHHR